MSFPSFAISVLAAAALLALFLSLRHVLLIGLAAAAGIFASALVDWWTKGAYQTGYVVAVLPFLYALAVVLGYRWPWKAWQWGLVPFLAAAFWRVAGPYATAHWGNLGPIPYLFPFYIAMLAAIPAMVAAELAAYIARGSRRK